MRKLLFVLAGCGLLVAGYFLFTHSGRFHQYHVDKEYTVHFHFPDLARQEFTDREKAEQDRDWMLYSLVAGAGLDKKQFAQVSYDLAPVRYGFNSTVANFDFGETRSKYLGDGEVVALVPKSDEKTRNDNIAHVLDEERKNQGEIPRKVYLFEYALNTEGNFAGLTRRDNVDGNHFFTEKMGYFEARIIGIGDLQSFMDHIDDVTYVRHDDNGFVFGGRRLFNGARGKATLADVAAIWQSESAIQRTAEQRKAGATSLETDYKAAMDQALNGYNNELKELRFTNGTAFSDLPVADQNHIVEYVSSFVDGKPGIDESVLYRSVYENDKALRHLIARMKKEVDGVNKQFEEKARELKGALSGGEAASASGFSLDPAIDFQKSIEFVERYRDLFAPALEGEFTVDDVIDQLRRKNGDLMEYAIAKLGKGLGGMVGLDGLAKQTCMYQRARYDGSLQGTAAGMTLFYTDLLAKIWAANMFDSHPDINITGFKDLEQTTMQTSVVFKMEQRALPSCRLWFGPNKSGFQMGLGKSDLFFARNATQIFAMSHDPGAEGSISKETGKKVNMEVQASKQFEVVLNWWNNHYEEVGDYEPQYQRLNEIMKWSTIIGWLNSTPAAADVTFQFLDTAQVDHTLWFPEWAKVQKGLRFTDLDKIGFYEKGGSGRTTESLPLLISANELFIGGVSLADKAMVKEAPELLSAEKNLVRRANLAQDPADIDVLKSFKDTKIKFVEDPITQAQQVSFEPKEGLKLRSRFGEVENTKFDLNISGDPAKGFALENKIGGLPIGKLRVTEEANGFSIGFDGDVVDKGMAISKEISDWHGDAGAFFRNHPEVSRAFETADGKWCVQIKGSDNWAVMNIDAEPSVNLPEGWTARVSGSEETSKIVEVKWVSEENVKALAEGKEFAPVRPEAAENAAQEKLAAYVGEDPQLVKSKVRTELGAALQSFESGNADLGVGYLNELLASPVAGKGDPAFFAEITNRIAKADVSPEARRKINNILKLYFTDDEVVIAGAWEGYKPLAKEVPLDQALNGHGVKIVYADTKAFRDLDPEATFQSTVGQIRAIPGVKAYEISGEEIGRNTRVYATLEKEPGAPGAGADGLPGGFDQKMARMRVRVYPGSAYNSCQNRDKNGDCEDKYSARGHIYYVTAPSLN